MDEQMIAALARKLAMFMFDTWGDAEGVVWAGLDPSQREKATKAARAAHSVMAGKVAELEAALKLWLAYDDQDEADFAQAGPMLLYARAIHATRAALAPHPKGME